MAKVAVALEDETSVVLTLAGVALDETVTFVAVDVTVVVTVDAIADVATVVTATTDVGAVVVAAIVLVDGEIIVDLFGTSLEELEVLALV